MKKHLPLFATLATVLGVGAAIAAGPFSQYPIVGTPANTNCLSYGNGGVCNQYSPAGPVAITGNEYVPADTNLPSQNPVTVNIPTGMIFGHGAGSERNALRGGDFDMNLWQRGTTFTGLTPTTAAMVADGFYVYSSGNSTTVTKQTTGSVANGFRASMRVVRNTGTDVTPICVGQILPATQTARFLGNNAVFSFYGLNLAGMSAVAGAVQVSVAYGTAADSATPGTNTDAFAKSTLTGYTAVTANNAGYSPNTTVSSAVATVPMSTTWTRYSVYGAIPTTATTIGVKICYTPVGTGGSTDGFEIANVQLEPAVTSVTSPGSFARRSQASEAALEYSYSWRLTETNGAVYPGGVLCTATGNAWIALQPPAPLRITPTVSVTAGGLSIRTAAAVTGIGTTTLISGSTGQTLSLTSGAACTTTLPYQLVGTNTTGSFTFSAEP